MHRPTSHHHSRHSLSRHSPHTHALPGRGFTLSLRTLAARHCFSWRHLAGLIMTALVLLIGACSSTPSRETTRPGVEESDVMLPGDQLLINELLRDARATEGAASAQLTLQAATLLFRLAEYDKASELLSPLTPDALPADLAAQIIALRAELLLIDDEPAEALMLLNHEQLETLPRMDSALQQRIRELRARSFFQTEQYLLSAQERIYLNPQLRAAEQEQNHERIWQALRQLPTARLEALSEDSVSYEFQGWYELALLGQRYQFNLDLQQVALERWLERWSRHPAAQRLPAQLLLIASLQEERPTRIALLLPLQSEPGRVVRDGFMSAYFNAREIGIGVPEVRFYDTSGRTDILTLHQQAREEGAELVIGPLLKDNVNALRDVRQLGVPTLVLNSLDGPPASTQLFQFALAPEDESRQLARRAWADGHRRVAILSPVEGGPDDYFRRKRESFIHEWQALGGTISNQRHYDGDYTQAISSLLDIQTSEYRHEQLSELLNTRVEFTPRRRQDIDFIFLLAQPGAGRQIKPSLGYLYAGDLPVYAAQDIYSGQPRPQVDGDLNGIVFSDSPWLLTGDDEFREETRSLFPQNSGAYLRLQAFGIDAFRLFPRLNQLSSMHDGSLPGATGELYMSDDRRISQRFSWAQIRNGQAQLLEPRAALAPDS